MAVGKSAVGRAVSRVLQMRFVDSDQYIEHAEGRSIPEIFEDEGEAYFRELERRFMLEGHPERGTVVACGGGLPIEPGMREILLNRGVVVSLFARVETIMERASRNNRRPLLNVEDPESRIRELLQLREPIYLSTGIGISVDGRSIAEVVQNVVRVYERESGISCPHDDS